MISFVPGASRNLSMATYSAIVGCKVPRPCSSVPRMELVSPSCLKDRTFDESISSPQEWMRLNSQQSLPLEEPAARVSMSLRNFVRRFTQVAGDSPLHLSA